MPVLVAFAVAVAPAAAQEEDELEPFMEILDVSVVNIDVWVTDKKGNPVEGLTEDDFLVYRDGDPIEVTNFYAVNDGRPVEEPGSVVEVPEPTPEFVPPPLPFGTTPGSEVAPEHRLWLIVFVDNFNSDPLERNRVLPSVQRFLSRTLREGDQAMVAGYDRSLEVLEPFTDDLEALMTTVYDLRQTSGLAVIRDRDRRATLKRIDDADESGPALLYARNYAEEQMNNVEHSMRALERLVDSLAGLPGRKALVHVSSGIPMLAGEEAFYAVAEKFGNSEAYAEIPRHDTTRSFERINRYANANRVAFYTIDAGGLNPFEFGAAEYGGFVNQSLRKTLDSVVPENLQSSLRLMALETGGKAIVNQNNVLPALEQAAKDFRSFYSLGITATADGSRYHEIEVKLREKQRGVDLRHRGGYRSKTTETRVRESLRSALLYSHQSNPLDVRLELGRAEPHGRDGMYLLPIQLQVPLEQAVLLPVGTGRHEARLRYFVGAVDGVGGTSEIDAAPLGVRLADEHVEAAKSESLVHTHKLILAPGRQKIGVAVLDLFGRQTSVVTRFIQIGPRDDAEDST